MTNGVVDNLFEYDNYRFFLKDYFEAQKKIRSTFSHRYFAQKSGFNSSSFLHHVIHGKRSLTEISLMKIIKGLNLKGRKAKYFKHLVLYNQTKDLEHREKIFKVLEQIRNDEGFKLINEKQLKYFEEWYYPVIREMAVYSNWENDYTKLGRMLIPSLSADKVKDAIELLLEIEMLVKNQDGSYSHEHPILTAGNIPLSTTRKIRRKHLRLAELAMETMPVDKRLISGTTVVMSKENYFKTIDKIDEFRKMIMLEALDDPKTEGVFQFNFQAFPLSHDIDKYKGNGGK